MVRIGFIGAGAIARVHLNALKDMSGVKVCAIADPILERAEEFAAACDGKAYRDPHDLLPEVDAVYINTPPSMHRDHVIAAAKAGKHVFCEKPLSVELEDTREIIAATQKQGVIFMVGFVLRFQKAFRVMKDFTASGSLGDIYGYTCHRLGLRIAKPGHWATEPGLLCGMTIQSFCHDTDLMCWLLDAEPVEINAGVRYREGLENFDEDLLATMKLSNGGVANFVLSWSSHLNAGERSVSGTLGSVSATGPNMWLVSRLDWQENASPGPRRMNLDRDALADRGYVEQSRHFVESVRRGINPSVGGQEGLRALEISTATLKAAREKRTVRLTEVRRIS